MTLVVFSIQIVLLSQWRHQSVYHTIPGTVPDMRFGYFLNSRSQYQHWFAVEISSIKYQHWFYIHISNIMIINHYMDINTWSTHFQYNHSKVISHNLSGSQLNHLEETTASHRSKLAEQTTPAYLSIEETEKLRYSLPSGKPTNYGKSQFHGKTHYKWPFSIAMFVYQRVYGI